MEKNLGAASAGVGTGSSESLDVPPYSLPGVLQFVQHEWARFERERSRWEIERAELQVNSASVSREKQTVNPESSFQLRCTDGFVDDR